LTAGTGYLDNDSQNAGVALLITDFITLGLRTPHLLVFFLSEEGFLLDTLPG
jgi:hypothetical protein